MLFKCVNMSRQLSFQVVKAVFGSTNQLVTMFLSFVCKIFNALHTEKCVESVKCDSMSVRQLVDHVDAALAQKIFNNNVDS